MMGRADSPARDAEVMALLKIWLDICLLRAGPQDLPASGTVLGVALAGYLVVNLLISVGGMPLGQATAMSVLDAAVLAAFTQFSLQFRELAARFNQTYSAMLGTGALIGLVALPVVRAAAPENGQAAGGPALLWLLLVLWSLAVLGHILRHALSLPLAIGVLLATGYTLFNIVLMMSLFPVSP